MAPSPVGECGGATKCDRPLGHPLPQLIDQLLEFLVILPRKANVAHLLQGMCKLLAQAVAGRLSSLLLATGVAEHGDDFGMDAVLCKVDVHD